MFNKFKKKKKNKIYKNSYLMLKILILQTNKKSIKKKSLNYNEIILILIEVNINLNK